MTMRTDRRIVQLSDRLLKLEMKIDELMYRQKHPSGDQVAARLGESTVYFEMPDAVQASLWPEGAGAGEPTITQMVLTVLDDAGKPLNYRALFSEAQARLGRPLNRKSFSANLSRLRYLGRIDRVRGYWTKATGRKTGAH